MLIARPCSAAHVSSDSTCMYRASTTRSARCSSTSSSSRSSASRLVAGVTGTWKNGRPAASAIGRRSSWLDTTATSSAPRLPARQRKIRSLRQWPSRDTMTSTRCGWSPVTWKVMPNASATGRNSADSRSASISSAQTNAVRRNNCPRTASSNCWCSTMSQPRSNRKELTACTMPGRSWQQSVRVNGWDTGASSALDDVERQPTAGGLLVLVLHVRTGLAHGLDRLVQRDVVPTVPPHRHAGGGDGLDRADGVALDARDLHEPPDRVAGEAQVVLDADLRGVLHLLRRPAEHLGQAGRGHRAGRAHLPL